MPCPRRTRLLAKLICSGRLIGSEVYVEVQFMRLDAPAVFVRRGSPKPSCPVCDAGYPAIKTVRTPMVQFEQFRFPRSKRVRIRKKWAKRQENFRFKDIV